MGWRQGQAFEDELNQKMAELAQGERSAFDFLFHALYPRALRLAASRLGPAAAPDVAQAALMRVFARASEFRPGAPVLPWFYAIVANQITADRRREARRAGQPADADLVAEGSDPETLLQREELTRALNRAVAALDRPSAEAIAAMLDQTVVPGLSATAFRKRASRAYARLRVLLRGSHGE